MYKFRRNGYCANPNAEIKSFVFSSKNKELRDKVELEGE
jgi:hypothetical protein